MTQPWVFVCTVNTPQALRALPLIDPDNWNLSALDDDNWAGAEMVADDTEKTLREIAPADTTIERDTKISVRITTPDFGWFKEWYDRSVHADMVCVYQTPDRAPKSNGDELYFYDKEGVIL